MNNDIPLDKLVELIRKGPHTVVDVRSPKEFEEATIPGSINIPVFSDEERAEIGTIYKQIGKEEAKERGLQIFSNKLPAFINEFKQIDTPITVFCWRGGMRSKTAASVLDLMGIHANRLSGGIRTYRQWVVKQLEDADFPPEFIVLNGYTGTGKTKLLHRLHEDGYPVMDLEGMAGHRGSIFGQIGLSPNNQKKFDSLLVKEMERLKQCSYVFVEGESRRIGRILLPSFIFDKKERGRQIFIELPVKERIRLILSDYHPELLPEQFVEAFNMIKKRLHTPVAKEIEDALNNHQFEEAVRLLLIHYYDPRYKHSAQMTDLPQNSLTISAETIDEVYDLLTAKLEKGEITVPPVQ